MTSTRNTDASARRPCPACKSEIVVFPTFLGWRYGGPGVFGGVVLLLLALWFTYVGIQLLGDPKRLAPMFLLPAVMLWALGLLLLAGVRECCRCPGCDFSIAVPFARSRDHRAWRLVDMGALCVLAGLVVWLCGFLGFPVNGPGLVLMDVLYFSGLYVGVPVSLVGVVLGISPRLSKKPAR